MRFDEYLPVLNLNTDCSVNLISKSRLAFFKKKFKQRFLI